MEKLDINQFKKYLVSNLGESLELIILEGSANSSSWIEGWSDIDFLIVVKDLSFELQRSLPSLSNKLEREFNTPVSLDAVSLKQITSSELFLCLNQAKTIQAIYEYHLFPSRLVYSKNDSILYKPSKEEILFISLRNVFYFYQEIHKAIQRTLTDDPEDLKSLTRRVLRHLFNLIKFAVQYKSLETPQGRKEIILLAKTAFNYIDLNSIEELSQNIQNWQFVSTKPEILQELLSVTLRYTDKFVFDFLKNDVNNSFGLFESIKK